MLREQLGVGADSEVFKAVWRNAPCVVKKMIPIDATKELQEREKFLKEAKFLKYEPLKDLHLQEYQTSSKCLSNLWYLQ